MSSLPFCDCSGSGIPNNIIQCRGLCLPTDKINIEKQIQNQVGVSESQMLDVKSTLYIGTDYLDSPENSTIYPFKNMSDRRNAHFTKNNNVPTRGNSVRSSVTSNKPGSMVPGGKGVDVKHGSYARYLGKLKAPLVSRTENNSIAKDDTRVINNKNYRFSIISAKCICNGINV